MKILTFFSFIFLINFNLQSQTNWQFKAGPNYTRFNSEKDTSPKIGYMLGVAKRFNIYDDLSVYGELDFIAKGAILKDRNVRPVVGNLEPRNAYKWDISGYLGYIELPILLSYTFPFLNNYNFRLFLGPSFSIPVKDLSNFDKKNFIETVDPFNLPSTKYEYNFEEESVFGNNSIMIIYHLGFDISYSNYSVELRYILDSRNNYYFKNLSKVNDKLNTFQLLIGYSI
jgi:Outer membrane protein beta-barrel domain